MSLRYQGGINLPGYNPLKVANAPTIGTATAGTAGCASVTFTAPACVGGGAISSYRVFANCGVKATSGASSPVVVTGLTNGTAYTFKVIATNVYGPSYPSASSNSVTASVVTCATYTTGGTYSWVAPTGVTSVSVVAIGSGGRGGDTYYTCCCGNQRGVAGGGGGGGLAYKNNYSVTPGSSYTVLAGSAGGASYFVSGCVVSGLTGNSSFTATGGTGGGYVGDGGGTGGQGGNSTGGYGPVGCTTGVGPGGGGAGGYSGTGGRGQYKDGTAATAGSGGGGGGGGRGCTNKGGAGGGGVGLFGSGSNGVAGSTQVGGGGGSGGGTGGTGPCTYNGRYGGAGGLYGGGGGAASTNGSVYAVGGAGVGAVRIVWCKGGVRGTPSFPSTNVGA